MRGLSEFGGVATPFPDLGSLVEWHDARARELFEFRVRLGFFTRMTDEEVADARHLLARREANH